MISEIKKYAVIAWFLFINCSCKSQQTIVSVSVINNLEKTINNNCLLGFNTQLLHGPSLNEMDFVKAIKGLNPSVLRYPGGTVANQWDWKTGWTLSPEFKNLPVIPYRLEEFKKAIDATNAMPVYVLNMCTSSLDDQIKMLQHAREIGLQVKFVELGNEFYLPQDLYVKTFLSGSDYANESNKWIKRIKKEFEDVQVAVVGRSGKKDIFNNNMTGKNADERADNWNSEVFAAIKNADAITFHIYGGNGIDNMHGGNKKNKHQKRSDYTDEERSSYQEAFESPNASKNVLGMAFHRFKQFSESDAKSIPAGMKIWITECNMFEKTGIVSGTWLHGLYSVALCLMLAESQKTDLVLYHTLAKDAAFAAIFNDNNGFELNYKKPSTIKNSYSAAGYALGMLMDASKQMKFMSPLEFDHQVGVTTNMESYNTFLGYCFSGNNQKKYLISNLSASAIKLNLKKLGLKNATYTQINCDPLKQITSANDLLSKSGTLTEEGLELKPYSILEIKSDN